MRALMYQNLGKLEYDAAVERRNKEASDSDALWSKHLHQAQQHLNNSVNIFNTSFFSVVNDDSTNCDIAYSKQLLAGVTCSLEDYQNGVRLWQETIALARSNTQGLDVGVHYDNLLLVMYNAGVCFYESNSLDLAMSILQQLLEMFEKSKHSTVVRINSDSELRAKELLGLVKDKLSHVKIEMESSAVGGASETEWEWEECHEGEADCEEVDLHLSQQKDATAETVATEQSVLPAEEEHDDETDEEWELELQEIQQRYAEQTATLMSMAEEDSLPNDVHHESYTYSKPTLQNTGKLGRMLSKLEISLDKLGQRFDLLQLEYFEVRGLVDSIRNEISTEN